MRAITSPKQSGDVLHHSFLSVFHEFYTFHSLYLLSPICHSFSSAKHITMHHKVGWNIFSLSYGQSFCHCLLVPSLCSVVWILSWSPSQLPPSTKCHTTNRTCCLSQSMPSLLFTHCQWAHSYVTHCYHRWLHGSVGEHLPLEPGSQRV